MYAGPLDFAVFSDEGCISESRFDFDCIVDSADDSNCTTLPIAIKSFAVINLPPQKGQDYCSFANVLQSKVARGPGGMKTFVAGLVAAGLVAMANCLA